MSNRTSITASKDIVFVPLNRLKKSPKNVRKIPHTKADITALAASIGALGMLQYPVVEPELGPKGKPTGNYLVNAGEGRRLAQLVRAKRKEIKADEPIRCVLDTEHSATEISLAENAIRTGMHPADQYEAFAKLHEEGMSAEDIAARFGVTPAVVRQRLKLGACSPKLMKLYRRGEMSLDQLSAFAITEDHERQERVWNELPRFNRSREAILHALSEGQVRSTDRRALFVGTKAYEQAGGVVIRDLFDPEGGGFFADAELLNRLARDKLDACAAEIANEGWRWVTAGSEFDREAAAGMRRVFPKAATLSKNQSKRLRKLQSRYDALCEKHQHEDELPVKAAEQLERIEAAIAAMQKEEYKSRDMALAGAFVTLAPDGSVRVERGFVRAEDDPASKAKVDEKNGKRPAKYADGLAPLSEKLVAELTAYRTSALRNELARHPDVALIALVHGLALDTFFPGSDGSCLEIVPRSAYLCGHAPGIDESVAEKQIAERHAAWGKRLPEDAKGLWTFIHGLSDGERSDLLAHCVSLTANALHVRGSRAECEADAAVLAREVGLDIAAYWQPTAASYFGRVSKERILQAVREADSNEAAQKIATMKKQAMAEAAVTALAGKSWLPSVLRQAPDEAAA
jgi:ParB family transcriptional regulator, chromosome partitioning protein